MKRSDDLDDICPRCKKTSETYLHLFQCQCLQNQTTFQSALKILKQNLQKCGTDYLIIRAFETILNSVHHNTTPACPKAIIRKRQDLKILEHVFTQQQGPSPLPLQKWMTFQNVIKNISNTTHKDLYWIDKIYWIIDQRSKQTRNHATSEVDQQINQNLNKN